MFVPPQIVRWSSRGKVIILRNVLVTSGKYDTSLGLAAGQWAAENTAFNFPQAARVRQRASISISRGILGKMSRFPGRSLATLITMPNSASKCRHNNVPCACNCVIMPAIMWL